MGAHSAPRGKAARSARPQLQPQPQPRPQSQPQPRPQPQRVELAPARARRTRQSGSLAARVFVVYWVLYGCMIIQSGMSNHLTIGYYLYSLLFWIMLPVAGISAVVAAERIAAMSSSEPPRWVYAVLGLCYISPVAITIADAIRLKGQRPTWWANKPLEQAATELSVLFLVWTIMLSAMMLGRALFQGRLRDRFWFCPPRWMAESG